MDLWRPEPDEPELLAWWWPLVLASRAVRQNDTPWPINIEEFALIGRVEGTKKRPPIWVYRHRESAGHVFVDQHGATYKFIAYASGRVAGRFKRIPVRHAVWAAGLPDVVKSVHGPRTRYVDDWDDGDPPADVEPDPAPTERGHLRLVR